MSIFAPSAPAPESTPIESPKTETVSPASPAVTEATETPGTPAAATPADAAEQPKEQPKSRAAERISQIYAQKKQAETQRDYALAEAQRLRDQLEKAPQIDPADFAAQETDRLRRVVKTERFEQVAGDYRNADRLVEQARGATFSAKVDAARDRIPDMDAALSDFCRLPVSHVVADFIADSDKAPEIAYYLAKNPQEAVHIHGLSNVQQAIALARIEARVTASQPKRLSQAPAPVQTVSGGSGGGQSSDLGTMNFADYEKARTAQMAAKG